MTTSEQTVRVSDSCHKKLLVLKGEILVRDKKNVSIGQIVEEMVDKCHSSIESYQPLTPLSQVEE